MTPDPSSFVNFEPTSSIGSKNKTPITSVEEYESAKTKEKRKIRIITDNAIGYAPYPSIWNFKKIYESAKALAEHLSAELIDRPLVLCFSGGSGLLYAYEFQRHWRGNINFLQVRKPGENSHSELVTFNGDDIKLISKSHYHLVFIDDFIAKGHTFAHVIKEIRRRYGKNQKIETVLVCRSVYSDAISNYLVDAGVNLIIQSELG